MTWLLILRCALLCFAIAISSNVAARVRYGMEIEATTFVAMSCVIVGFVASMDWLTP